MNDKMLEEYFNNMVNSVYKILPLFEERNEGLFKHIQSLTYELNGLPYLDFVSVDYQYITLLATLESMSDDALIMSLDASISEEEYKKSLELIRREVFKCINIVNNLASKSGDK